jgi:hypothetical protein
MWNCPLLEHLEIFSTIVTELGMKELSLHFQKLTYLSAVIESTMVFTISDFPKLQTLLLHVSENYEDRSKNTIQLRICNIPNLSELDICDGSIASLELSMTPNLKQITTTNGFDMKSVIFHDDVPLLDDVNFGYDELSITNGSHVNWKNMKHLNFVYSNGWSNIVSELVSLKTLEITQSTDEPNVPWSKLSNLTTVVWTWPSFNILSHITCVNLKDFQLQWDDDDNFILDFGQFLHFAHLEHITLSTTSGKYVNFEAILQLPKHVKFLCMMDNLTEAEESIVKVRNEMHL